jgi:hypothetical protein
MLGGDALDLEIAIGEVRRDLAKGFIWFLSGSNPMMCSRRGHRRLSQARQMALCVTRRADDSIWEPTGSNLQKRYASEAMSMPDQDDWEFAGPDDAKAEIRAAVEYLLRGATGGARGDIVQEIIAIVRQVASGLPPEPPNSLDDGLPGG